MSEIKLELGGLESDVLTSTESAMSFVKKEETNVAKTPSTYDSLPVEDKKLVDDLSSRINITDTALVINYGVDAQKHMADFSNGVLKSVKTKDTGEVGVLITDLVGRINTYNDGLAPKKGIAKLFSNAKKDAQVYIAKYNDMEKNISTITDSLESKSVMLSKDVNLMETLFEENLVFFKELTLYILAGKKKLDEYYNVILPELRSKVQNSSDSFAPQELRDLEEKVGRFEKRIYDLELTRQISIQTAPQIRMLQNNDIVLIEKIQSSIVNTIPLWKNQMVIALGIDHAREAAQAQAAVTDLTNKLLLQNVQQLRLGSIEVAKESERGIVDIETLKKTNKELIDAMDDVMKIQSDGRKARIAAEKELQTLENELKVKLLSASNQRSEETSYDGPRLSLKH